MKEKSARKSWGSTTKKKISTLYGTLQGIFIYNNLEREVGVTIPTLQGKEAEVQRGM